MAAGGDGKESRDTGPAKHPRDELDTERLTRLSMQRTKLLD
jgi:hypothetical protein